MVQPKRSRHLLVALPIIRASPNALFHKSEPVENRAQKLAVYVLPTATESLLVQSIKKDRRVRLEIGASLNVPK